VNVLDSFPHPHTRRTSLRRNIMRWLLLVTAVVCVLVIGYLAMAGLIAVVMVTAEGARLSLGTTLLVALPSWLAAHQVPLTIGGAPLTVFPLVPTALMMLLIGTASSRVARRSRIHRAAQARSLIAVMTLSHAVSGAAIAVMLGDAVTAAPIDAFLWCGLTALIASTAGVVNRCGLTYAIWERVDADIWSGLRVGLLALGALVGAGALVVFAGICLSVTEMYELLSRSGSAGDAFGSTLLSILYVPNAVIAGWSFATGTGLSAGRFEFQPLDATPVSVPDVPLLVVLPSSEPSLWWAVVFVLPATVGVLVGRSCLRVHSNASRRLRAVAVAALVAALGTFVLAQMVGGRLGGGPFDPVTLHPGSLAVATFCWIAIPASAVAWFAASRTETEAEDESAEDVIDAYGDDTGVPLEGATTPRESTSEDTTTEDGTSEDNTSEDRANIVDDTDELLVRWPDNAEDLLVAEIEEIDPSEFDIEDYTGDERPR
jgi:hypothetical protein